MRHVFPLFRFATALLWLIALGAVQAEVVRVEVTERKNLPISGLQFERIAGRVYFAIDPAAEANQRIADIALAPTNADGKVEFSSDFLIFRPTTELQSNGTALVEVPNRGRPLMFSGLNIDSRGEMRTEEDFGDAFTLREGFTMAWVGWQFDVPQREGSFKLYAPVLDQVDGEDITGPVRVEVITNDTGYDESLPYPVADPDSATLTVRDEVYGSRKEIPASEWSFNEDLTGFEYPSGFTPGRIYEFIYTAKDPAVAGLGFAAMRDFVSHLKNEPIADGVGQAGEIQRAIGYGFSQSGRYLRNFLYDGFNVDEEGRQVFDLVWAHGAGAGRGSFNQRFAQPGRTTGQFTGSYYPTDLPPYHPNDLLAKSVEQGVTPRLILTNGSHEYWGRGAGLNHASINAETAPDPETTRFYLLAGTQHGTGGRLESRDDPRLQYPTNPMDWTFFMRAMLMNAQEWIALGYDPPPSQFPSGRQIVAPEDLDFPVIPGVPPPTVIYNPWDFDYGPEYQEYRIVSVEPPTRVREYRTRVAQVNTDGNETTGVVMPELAAPLGTYLGWNLRSKEIGAAGQLYSLIGSFIPFPLTAEERQSTGDSRRAISERYANGQDYEKRIRNAARGLALERLVLEQDIDEMVERAMQHWDQWVLKRAATQ